jgi:hypothetical protein
MSAVERVRTGTSTLRQALIAWRGDANNAPIRCEGCLTEESETNKIEIHHIVPWADGGTDDPRNLLFACHRCHMGAHEILGESGAFLFQLVNCGHIPVAREAWFYLLGMKNAIRTLSDMNVQGKIENFPKNILELVR